MGLHLSVSGRRWPNMGPILQRTQNIGPNRTRHLSFRCKKKKTPSLLSPLLVALPVALSPRAATGWPPPLPPCTRFPGLRRVICGDEHPPGTGTPSLPFLLCGTEHPNPNLTCLYSDLIWVRVYKCPVYTCILTSIFMQLFGLYMSTLMSFYLVRPWP
jgi:hypothetical protein